MANQVVVTQSGNVQVSIQPTPNVQVQVSRAAITTLASVANANYANFAGQVVTSSQPNITSLGTLTSLTSSGNITAPYFIGNVVGNISGNIVVPGTNTSVLFNDAGVAGASDAFQFNKSSNTVTVTGNLSATNISGNGSGLSSITGANVTGEVSYAAVANSVSGSNVSGAVAYATTANSVAGGNVSGQVAYAAVANSVAGANVSGAVNLATYATTANSVAGANVSGTVANATHATVANSANSVAGANVSGQVSYAAVANSVALANVSGAGNIASINIDGNGGNVLYGNGVFAAVVSPTSVANANYANYAGNVTTSAQPNITSLGTLTGLTVAGDATVTGNLAVDGNLTYVNVTNLVVQDPVIEMGGGPNGAPLTTNDGRDRGSLLHYYTTQPVDAFMGWDNSNGEFGFGSNVTNTNDVMTFNSYGNVRASTFIGNLTGTASHATVADSANSVAGANVTGQVSYAAVANSVAGSNVSGQVSYAAVANSVAGANVSGDVSGANHANVADVANSVSGSNVSGAVNLANYATVANSVAVANVSGIGNIAVLNLDGNVSNILHGNGFWGPESESGNANYANFAGTAFSVSGSNVVGEVANAAYATNSGHATVADSANSVAGGNVTGQVANALVAGTVYTNAQPNITSVGTLVDLSVNGNVTIGGDITSVDSITIDVAATEAYNVAKMYWNVSEGTLNLGMYNSVVQQIGQELYFYGKASSAITNGQSVMFAGVQGDHILMAPADASSVGFIPQYVIGIATQDIANGDFGYVTWFGKVNDVTTNGFAAGDQLYFDPTVVGGVTDVRPSAPNPKVLLCAVVKAETAPSANNGILFVRPTFGPTLNDIQEVEITTAITGQALVYNGSNVWINGIPNIANIAYSVSGSNVSGDVSGANHANVADVANSVSGSNVSGEVAYAAVANSVAVANVSGIGNIATINLDGNISNILHGDGSWGPEGETGNANYAAYAGNVTIAAQSNITSLGNLTSVTVANSVTDPRMIINPTGNVIGLAPTSNGFVSITNYGNVDANLANVQSLSFIKARGNINSQTAAANSDQIMVINNHVYNGNTYPKASLIRATAPLAANTTFTSGSTVWTPGLVQIVTGNPNGNVTSTTALNAQNQLTFNQNGTFVINPGRNSNGASVPVVNTITYGVAANGVGGTMPIMTQRARGDRDAPTAVGNTDTIGSIGFQAYNGNAFFSTRFAQIRANVNTNHGTIANGASVPTDLEFVTCSNTTGYSTYIYGNGSASFPGAVTSAGALTVTSGNISASNGNLNVTAGNIVVNGTTASPRNFVVNNGGAIFTIDNVDTTTASFAFATYNNANSLVNPYTFYRGRGTVASPAAVQAGDTVSSIGYNVYGDSGNAYVQVATSGVNVIANDGAGNVTADYAITASKISLAGNVYPNNVVFTKFNETVNSASVSGTITPDVSTGTIFNYTLTGNVTINSLANVVAGSSATLILTQDGTGSRTLTSSMLFAGAEKTLSTAAGAKDIISVFYDGSTYYATLSKGYA